MKYFKIIKENTFIGIITSDDFRRFQIKHKRILVCDENTAQYAWCQDKMYRDNWLSPLITDLVQYELADITEITKEEYDELYEMIEQDEEITPTPEPEPEPEPIPDEQEQDITVEYAKQLKIKEMSNACQSIIYSGIDVTLADGESHHFSLTDQDQKDLSEIKALAKDGVELLPYHEDGQLCKFYSATDILAITTMATNYIIYHTTYFNSLQAYIKSLRSLNTISRVEYGMEIPEKYQSEVWKALNQNENT